MVKLVKIIMSAIILYDNLFITLNNFILKIYINLLLQMNVSHIYYS